MARRMYRGGVYLGISLSLLTAWQLLASFGIQWYTIARLGAGSQTDALYAGSTLLQLCSAVVLDQVSVVLVPLLAAREEHERAALAWPLFVGIGSLFALVTLLLYGVAPYLVPLMAPGFSDPTAVLAVELARIQLLGPAWSGLFYRPVRARPSQKPVLGGQRSGVDSTLVGC